MVSKIKCCEKEYEMESNGLCRFCDIVKGKFHYGDIDKPIAHNEEFYAIASIGALVEGWTLIIPYTHQLSMRKTYVNPLFLNLAGKVLPSLIEKYGSVIAFEHGANKEESITACGTDHAHIHLVPWEGSLFYKRNNYGMKWDQCRASEIADKANGKEYLFYAELGGKESWEDPLGVIHILENPTSQFFRKIIAEQLGRPEVSDYKIHPRLSVARQTRNTLVAPSF